MLKLFGFVILIFVFVSCRKMVQDEFPFFENATTINAFLIADSVINIQISETGKLDNKPLSIVENAVVKLYINDSLVEFVHSGNGVYTSGVKAAVENTYRCEVLTENNSLSKAYCSIPESPIIQSVQLYPNAWLNDEGLASPVIHFSIKNNPQKLLYFESRIVFYSKSTYENDSIDFRYDEEQSVALFTNEYDIGTTLSKRIEFASNNWGSNNKNAYVLEIRSLSQSAYEYLKSMELYELGRYPNFGTGSIVPYNIYNNVTNGYGIFAGYSSVFSNMLIDNTKGNP